MVYRNIVDKGKKQTYMNEKSCKSVYFVSKKSECRNASRSFLWSGVRRYISFTKDSTEVD